MGLKLACVAILIGLLGCMGKSVVAPVKVKYYIECCSPTLNAHEKDMCKWAKDNPNKIIVEWNYRYEMLWSNCEVGKEPWRRWE